MGNKEMQGKIVLLTGATEGIGKAAAFEFARRGASLTLVGRNEPKTRALAADLERVSGGGGVEVLIGDLSRMADVRAVAKRFRESHDRLDVLANNAGGLFQERQLTCDGVEMTFALNHLSYFLLTHELLDLLKKTPGARVVSTASAAHRSGWIDVASIATCPNGRASWGAYGNSKLANILFTRELARRLEGTGVTANCFHPGFVATGFGLNNGPILSFIIKTGMRLFARTPEKGAETLVWLATSPEAGNVTGEYFYDRRVAGRSRAARDDAMARELWRLSEKLCGHEGATP